MRPKLSIVIVSISLLLVAAPVPGHHRLITEYDVTKPVTLRGTLTRVEWVNPHGWIYMDVSRPDAEVESWAIETGSPYSLVKRGLSMTDLVPGIEIVVNGFLAKNGTRTAAGENVTLLDRQVVFQLGR
jgi:hypothetical protein